MRPQPRATRAFDTARPIEIFRVAGRRPANVWVDDNGTPTASGNTAQRMKELVYWRTRTRPGEQIQERLGGLYVVTTAGDCHPVALSEPQEATPETAFLGAQSIRERDAARVAELIASGDLVEGTGLRLRGPPSRPGDRLLPAGHPLIVDERPADIDAPTPPPRRVAPQRWS
ncbi:MAG: hypothetical protein IT561_21325 [Alphaproteobacteria bacterium]|nr:hypothetical protein [Alphaproteobacteria bacterium]